ncbi:TonB-dependent receptor [Pyrinomonas methylaliphatogenes]|uniref:Outer membrane receptor protein n=1 Tax=Pyrinomonas methylaliphatogenes TaxID=454194 RepID=A0A0B6WVA7_9BACT|nr:TonB-dependent receptor [Pyrinomonas methylaliphatogenes]CDM64697.1 outer membrane receptor protein [Pyrinomonas methylaliphatogenes]
MFPSPSHKLWLFAGYALLAASQMVSSQDLDDVSLRGRVRDAHGSVVVGATVTATLRDTARARQAVTDEEGRFSLLELEPGSYIVRAAAPGFATAEIAIETIAGQTVELDIALHPVGVAAEQTVVAETGPYVPDVSRTVIGATVTREEVESLPVQSRAPYDLVFTLSNVTEPPFSDRDLAEDRDSNPRMTPEEAGLFALSGGPAYSNNLTIEGFDNNDDRAARERFQPSMESVEEVQIITNQFAAEYGRASGGRVNLRVRRGTNELRGKLFDFFRDESLEANTFRNNARGLKRLPLQRHDLGFAVGGPVMLPRFAGPLRYNGLGRTYFFLAYEFNTVLDSTLIDTLVPIQQNPRFPLPPPTTLVGRRLETEATPPNQPAELAPFVDRVSTPSRKHETVLRVDHEFSQRHSGMFLYQHGRLRNRRQMSGGNRLREAFQTRYRASDALAYADTRLLTPKLINQFRAQASRLAPEEHAPSSRPVVTIALNDPLGRSGTLVAGSSSLGATLRREARLQLQDSLTSTRGTHTFKTGGELQLVRSAFRDLADLAGTYSFASAGDFLANQPSRFRQSFQPDSVQRNVYLAFFAQDEWRPANNFTLSFGLRYERETIIADGDNWGPRIGIAFDPTKGGKMVLRAGAGIFYNRALLRTIDDFTLGTRRLIFDTDLLRDPATGRALTPAQRRAFIAANLNFPETLTLSSPLVQRFATSETGFMRRLDPNLRIPESYQLSFGIEREIKRGWMIEANYAWVRGLHLWREFNANAPVLPAGYSDFTAYLLSRDFPNFRDAAGVRPLYDASTAGEFIRFMLTPNDPANPNSIGRIVEAGVPISLVNLNGTSQTALEIAHAAVNDLRPDPTRGEIEQLASIGNSSYRGLTLETRHRLMGAKGGFSFTLRASYTLSKLISDGELNTSDALRPGDFRHELARSLLDRRHRFALSGIFDLPAWLGRLRLAPILRLASSAPFNITLGADRNLDDVDNDRPNFSDDPASIRFRRPGEPLDQKLVQVFSLPTIGSTGNLPRNAGTGPALFAFDLNIARVFRLGESARLQALVECDNVLNKTVFSFGAEFINFNALGANATPEQRSAFKDTFLVPQRTLRPRQIRLGLRLEF